MRFCSHLFRSLVLLLYVPCDFEVRTFIGCLRSLLASGSLRAACQQVLRWQLQETFDPSDLVQRLHAAGCYTAALRFSRDFGLAKKTGAPLPGERETLASGGTSPASEAPLHM